MLTQLQSPIPLSTPKGAAWAVAIIDYGPQWDLQWVTFVHDTGECWTFRNQEVRQEKNFTFGLPKPTAVTHEQYETLMRPADIGPTIANDVSVHNRNFIPAAAHFPNRTA